MQESDSKEIVPANPTTEEPEHGSETVDSVIDVRAPATSAGRMLPILVEQGGTKPEDLHLLDRRETTIGRDSRSNIVIPDSRVSRKHAIIAYENLSQVDRPPSCILYDAGSRNGTYLNGARIEKPASLKEADQIVIGGRVFSFFVRSERELRSETRLRSLLAEHGYSFADTRVPVDCPVDLQVVFPEQTFSPQSVPATAKDLSCKGIRLVTNHFTRDMYLLTLKATRYAKVHLVLPGTGQEMNLHGRVAWMHFDMQVTPPLATIGIEFDRVEEEMQKVLEEYIRKA